MAGYIYYLYAVDDDNLKTVEEIFNEGIKKSYSSGRPSFDSNFQRVGKSEGVAKDFDLNEAVVNATKNGGTAFVIKIPEEYIEIKLHKDNTVDIPVPLFSKGQWDGENKFKCDVFTPHLVQGAYSAKNGSITNPNYSPIYDANGMRYSNEQYQQVRSFAGASKQVNNLINLMEKREKAEKDGVSFDEIWKRDMKSGFLNTASEYYANIYPKNETHLSHASKQTAKREDI